MEMCREPLLLPDIVQHLDSVSVGLDRGVEEERNDESKSEQLICPKQLVQYILWTVYPVL